MLIPTAIVSNSGLPDQWTEGANGNVTAQVDLAATTPFTIKGIAGQGPADFAPLFRVRSSNDALVLLVDSSGDLFVTLLDASASLVLETPAGQELVIDGSGNINLGLSASLIGFFGQVAVARPAGVPVTAAGIHAALVSLGLITA